MIFFLVICAAFIFTLSSCDIQNPSHYSDVFKDSSFGNPSPIEMSQGVRQALEVAALKGISRLSVKDGFFGDNAIKIRLGKLD